MPFVRLAQRIFDKLAIERRFEFFDFNWESNFSGSALSQGRKLYTSGAVKVLELRAEYASASLKLEDGTQPYCIIDFFEKNFSVRGSSSDEQLNMAYAVAALYEVEELLADQITPLKYEPVQNELSKSENLSAVQEPNAEKFFEEEDIRKLKLFFSVKKNTLSFAAKWQTDSGLKNAFGKNSLKANLLKLKERESLVRIASFARKAGFSFNGKCYVCGEPSRFQTFCVQTLSAWQNFFDIEKNRDLDLLAEGVKELSLCVSLADAGESSAEKDFLSANFYSDFNGATFDFEDLKFLQGAGSGGRFIAGKGLFKIADEDCEKFLKARRTFDSFGGKIPKYMLFTLFDEFSKRKISDSLKDWKSQIFLSSQNLELPDFLREYQKDAIRRADSLFKSGCGMLLADEMGLGKTIQTLSIIRNYWGENSKFLIVCPASVIPVWKGEIEKFYPEISFVELCSASDFSELKSAVVLASYTQLRRNRQKIEPLKFKLAVLDEAQFIKNPESKISQACASISSEHKLALTGTPIENSPLDMWSIFRWLMPGLLGVKPDFEERVVRDKDFSSLLKKQIAPFVVRRLKSEVLDELPAKNFVDLLCPMSAMQASEYQKLFEEARSAATSDGALNPKRRFSILSALTRLRQAACDPALLPWIDKNCPLENSGKIQSLCDALLPILSSNSRVVIFSQFTSFLERIKLMVAAHFPNVKTFELIGATKDRATPVKKFQSLKEAAVMFVSLRAGGTGITLTNADYVFLADPWWNPAVEEQAIDRVHRIGKKSDVFIYRLITDSSVEQRVRKLQERKKTLFENILGGINSGKSFDEAVFEILEL